MDLNSDLGEGFGRWELGYATAMAEMLFLLVLVVTAIQYRATMDRDATRL